MEASQTTPQTDEVSPEDLAKAGQVSIEAAQAGVTELQKGGNEDAVRRAVEETLERKLKDVKFQMTDEDRQDIADRLVDGLKAQGAFDPPPSAGPAQVPTTPEAAAEQHAEIEAQSPPPRKRTWAERHFGED